MLKDSKMDHMLQSKDILFLPCPDSHGQVMVLCLCSCLCSCHLACFFRKSIQLWCCKEEPIPFTGILSDANEASSDLHDTIDVLKCMIHPDGTEWYLTLVDSEMPIHKFLVYLWICGLQGLHFCKVDWNQPGILLLVMNKDVFA